MTSACDVRLFAVSYISRTYVQDHNLLNAMKSVTTRLFQIYRLMASSIN